jgi:hypothetical protein
LKLLLFDACSALRDTRFPPVQQHEVAQLSCSVSLLSCFEEAANWQDWEIGTHGLIIEFTDPVLQCKRTATFLPEVAADQGWTKRQCIESLIRKAGQLFIIFVLKVELVLPAVCHQIDNCLCTTPLLPLHGTLCTAPLFHQQQGQQCSELHS